MPESRSEPDYTVLVTQRDGEFELRIPELLLVERGASLEETYTRLIRRKREIVEWARSIDSLDELPPARPAPALGSLLPKLPGGQS
jgi:hypothetical protein